MASALFKQLGRQGRGKTRALAKKLGPTIPRTERVIYDRKLRAFWNLWSDAVRSDLRLHRLDGRLGMRRQDARPLLTATYQQLLENSRLGDFLEGLGNRVTGKAQAYMKRVVRIPVRMRGKEDLLADFRTRNIALIKDLGHEQVEKLDVLLMNAHNAGVRNEDLAPQVQEVLDVGESRAALIARDQILKLNGQAQQLAQTEAGIEEYVWSTSEDERVRESHQALDGRTFSWDEPPTVDGERVHPGEAIQCRCVPVPVIPLFAGLDLPAPEEPSPTELLDPGEKFFHGTFRSREAAEAKIPRILEIANINAPKFEPPRPLMQPHQVSVVRTPRGGFRIKGPA